MLLQREGLPNVSEIVMCTVKNISGIMVTVSLDEYDNQTGLIHISEISPGRIRNIRDYVKEGKKIVCKILTVNKERGHIDLSLRRVNESARREKVDELKHERIAEGIVETLVKTQKLELDTVYHTIFDEASKKHDFLYPYFEEVVLKGDKVLQKLDLTKEVIDELATLIIQRIKPPVVEINTKYYIESYREDAANLIKAAFEKAIKKVKNMEVVIKYLGSGYYSLNAKDETFKQAEKKVKLVDDIISSAFENDELTEFRIEREKAKAK